MVCVQCTTVQVYNNCTCVCVYVCVCVCVDRTNIGMGKMWGEKSVSETTLMLKA